MFGDGWWGGFVFAGRVVGWVGFRGWVFGMDVAEGEEAVEIQQSDGAGDKDFNLPEVVSVDFMINGLVDILMSEEFQNQRQIVRVEE